MFEEDEEASDGDVFPQATSMARIDPLRNFRYRLEIDNITQAGFSEVMIAETTIDAVDYREGTVRRAPLSGSEITIHGA